MVDKKHTAEIDGICLEATLLLMPSAKVRTFESEPRSRASILALTDGNWDIIFWRALVLGSSSEAFLTVRMYWLVGCFLMMSRTSDCPSEPLAPVIRIVDILAMVILLQRRRGGHWLYMRSGGFDSELENV